MGGSGGGETWGPGARGASPYAYSDGGFGFEGGGGRGGGRAAAPRETGLHTADRRNEGASMRGGRRLPDRDVHGQSSLERLEEENSSLRAITKYLIHERKELRKKADTASKRNQNLNNLLQVIEWSLQQSGAGGSWISIRACTCLFLCVRVCSPGEDHSLGPNAHTQEVVADALCPGLVLLPRLLVVFGVLLHLVPLWLKSAHWSLT